MYSIKYENHWSGDVYTHYLNIPLILDFSLLVIFINDITMNIITQIIFLI